MSDVADPQVAGAFDSIAAALDRLADTGLDPVDVPDAYVNLRELEAAERRLRAMQVELLTAIDRSGLHKPDGHASAKVMVRYAANLSNDEALRRDKAARMLRYLPTIAAAFASGRLGACQVQRIARTFGNKRVRDALIGAEAHVAVLAQRLPYKEFDLKLAQWEQMADEDGAGDRAERNHENRDFKAHTNFDGSVRTEGGFGSVQGAEIRTIHEQFTHLEWLADWAEARERLGDAATVEDLIRTEAQRRADALEAICRAAAAAQAAEPGGSVTVMNIVMDYETFLRETAKLAGEKVAPDDRRDTFFTDLIDTLEDDPDLMDESDETSTPDQASAPDETSASDGTQDRTDSAPQDEGATPDDADVSTDERGPKRPFRQPFRRETEDGHPINPTEAAAMAMHARIRRVVVGADGVPLDVSRTRRLFTGPARLAVMLSNTTCYWPGCNTPVSHCQADHLDAFNGPRQGRTDPGNGGPACGRHNRFKERGFTTRRDEHGRWHVYRPDGTEITEIS